MAHEEWTKRVLEALHTLGKRQRGALVQAERAADVATGYVRKRRDAGTMDLRKLFTILESLGEQPSRFFRRVFPEATGGISRYLDPPSGPVPLIVNAAHKRLTSERPSSITNGHLVHLDSLRYEHPAQAVRSTEEALPFLPPTDIPLSLGVWASAKRTLLDFNEATHALFAGLSIAEQQNDLGSCADLLIRLSYIVCDSGDFGRAIYLAREATDCFVRTGDLGGAGKSLVDRGVHAYYQGHYQEAIALLKQGLPLLPEGSQRYRATVFQVLGLTHLALSDFEATASCIEKALPEAEDLGPLVYGKTLWLAASLHFSQQQFENSEAILHEVVDRLKTVHAGEAALATIDLAQAQLLSGRPSSAAKSVREILPLISTLGGHNRIIRSAERVLADLASKATLTLDTLGQLRTLVQSIQRERHLWRSLAKQS